MSVDAGEVICTKDVPLFEVLLINNLPLESIRILSVPFSEKAMVSAAGKKMPVLVSPVVVMDGVPTAPAATVTDVAEAAPKTGVTNVGLVARTLLPVPVLVTLTMFLLASSARAVDAVKPVSVLVPVITAVPMLAVVTLAKVADTFVSVRLPLLTVTFASVMLLSVVTVFPSWIAVLPSVIVVAKLLSRLDNGIAAVAVPKV